MYANPWWWIASNADHVPRLIQHSKSSRCPALSCPFHTSRFAAYTYTQQLHFLSRQITRLRVSRIRFDPSDDLSPSRAPCHPSVIHGVIRLILVTNVRHEQCSNMPLAIRCSCTLYILPADASHLSSDWAGSRSMFHMRCPHCVLYQILPDSFPPPLQSEPRASV